MVREERERKRGDLKHLSVHQWIRSAIPDSQQPISPIGFLFLKLPPPACAVLLVYSIYIYIYIDYSQFKHGKIIRTMMRAVDAVGASWRNRQFTVAYAEALPCEARAATWQGSRSSHWAPWRRPEVWPMVGAKSTKLSLRWDLANANNSLTYSDIFWHRPSHSKKLHGLSWK